MAPFSDKSTWNIAQLSGSMLLTLKFRSRQKCFVAVFFIFSLIWSWWPCNPLVSFCSTDPPRWALLKKCKVLTISPTYWEKNIFSFSFSQSLNCQCTSRILSVSVKLYWCSQHSGGRRVQILQVKVPAPNTSVNYLHARKDPALALV